MSAAYIQWADQGTLLAGLARTLQVLRLGTAVAGMPGRRRAVLAQVAISANENKVVSTVVQDPAPATVEINDRKQFPPRILAEIKARPASPVHHSAVRSATHEGLRQQQRLVGSTLWAAS